MFTVETEESTVKLDADKLAKLLVAKSIASSDETLNAAVPQLALAMARTMEASGVLKDATPTKLLALGLDAGYVLNTFLRTNKVQVEFPSAPSDDSVNDSSETPGSPDGSTQAGI